MLVCEQRWHWQSGLEAGQGSEEAGAPQVWNKDFTGRSPEPGSAGWWWIQREATRRMAGAERSRSGLWCL